MRGEEGGEREGEERPPPAERALRPRTAERRRELLDAREVNFAVGAAGHDEPFIAGRARLCVRGGHASTQFKHVRYTDPQQPLGVIIQENKCNPKEKMESDLLLPGTRAQARCAALQSSQGPFDP